MNYSNIEKIFVENFIDKEYRERIIYELSSNKKREKALSRLSHDAINILYRERIIIQSCQLLYDDIKNYMRGSEKCYLLGGNIDQSIMRLKDCFNECMNNPLSVVIICDNGLVIVKEELTIGPPTKYVMYFDNIKHLYFN